MNRDKYDVVVVGGGAAGMSAAIGAAKQEAKVLLIERDVELGGVLLQCIHNGFGLHHFKQELTGPAYAERVEDELHTLGIDVLLNSVVTQITKQREVHVISPERGYQIVSAGAIVYAVGCRERTRYQIDLPGPRLAGIMTAGHAQHYVNIDGYMVGRRILILGSGDIGLIMARRMTLEGATVVGVAELMPYSNGLNRNIVQCLHDFEIPLYLSHTVVNVEGHQRLERVTLAQVDSRLQPIPGTEKHFDVDTLLLSVGLIPENKLLRDIGIQIHPKTSGAIVNDQFETSHHGIFACGNALHVHDLVDYVSEEGELAGRYAACYALKQSEQPKSMIEVVATSPIRYVLPGWIHQKLNEPVVLKFRVSQPLAKGTIVIRQGERILRQSTRLHMIPSEMERIELSTTTVLGDGVIQVSIEGGIPS